MNAYDPNFLDGFNLPLPSFAPHLQADIVEDLDLTGAIIADYVHYSLAMNGAEERRSPVFVALNIDQNLLKKTNRTDRWRIDPRIAPEFQLDNAYYRNNDWDRGHMARRTSAAWGANTPEAQRASNETFYYTNACLQHANLNQDEWLGLEDWVYALELDKDGKITSYSGPFYADYDRSVHPSGQPLALVPAGFFKIVCFVNKQDKLEVRAFIIYQDEKALADKSGRKKYNNQVYQTTVAQIEELTGLQFEPEVYHANPMKHCTRPTNTTSERTVNGEPVLVPEMIEVAKPSDIQNEISARQTIKDDVVDIFISAALVNPRGKDRGNEWIALINLGAEDVDLTNWTLTDNQDHPVAVGNVTLAPGESVVIKQLGKIQLGNNGDVIKLYDDQGARIDWVNYTDKMVKPGVPVLFLSPRDTLDLRV
ncbi:DNA/RNA endonuclease [Alteromonas aestuariivivens]|uniref:DNA/RNA endonuclease n=1 Tax=Alteromonas aestuariivivens TaxID=1938339 RepID=A0A3D8MFG5_9ALTE|nr:DNA/RNA non-specific endonuclease [Alteromonas aestuariivivens]RDV29350.1 DNA/RNA endonuclease [Alteromonas aestuariivivens]